MPSRSQWSCSQRITKVFRIRRSMKSIGSNLCTLIRIPRSSCLRARPRPTKKSRLLRLTTLKSPSLLLQKKIKSTRMNRWCWNSQNMSLEFWRSSKILTISFLKNALFLKRKMRISKAKLNLNHRWGNLLKLRNNWRKWLRSTKDWNKNTMN